MVVDTYHRISKRTFYNSGGFANTRQFRKMRAGVWTYWYYNPL